MTNPPHILRQLDAVCSALAHERCYAFLHVPVQSGSDAVLAAMRREYTVEDFQTVADALLLAVPEATLATDIICGLPGETEADHGETLRLLRRYRFPVLNISQFYPRPGTPAGKMKRVPSHVVKERTRELSALFGSYATFERLLGREAEVLVTDWHSHKGLLSLVAHDKGYVQAPAPPPCFCYTFRPLKPRFFDTRGD